MQAAAGSKDAQGTRDFLTSPLHKLGPDIISNLQLHLKPRHVLKLMLRCKNMFQILDSNDQYWARVAAHAVWRDLYELEITPEAAEIQRNILLKDEHNLYYTIGLDRGYYWSMERFLSKIPDMMCAFQNTYIDWNETRGLSLEGKTIILYERFCWLQAGDFEPQESFKMKLIAQYFISVYGAEERKINISLQELDDDPMPNSYNMIQAHYYEEVQDSSRGYSRGGRGYILLIESNHKIMRISRSEKLINRSGMTPEQRNHMLGAIWSSSLSEGNVRREKRCGK